MEFHSIYENLKWELDKPCQFFNKQLTRFDWSTDSSGSVVYRGYDSMVVINNQLIKRIIYRNGSLQSIVSYEYDNNSNMSKQVLEEWIGPNFDTIIVYENEYIYAGSGEILEHIKKQDNKNTSDIRLEKTQYFYSSQNLSKRDLAKTINLYPNPSTNLIHFNSIEGLYNIEISDLSGKIIDKINNTSSNQIDISKYTNGIYVIKINSEEAVYTAKIIKI